MVDLLAGDEDLLGGQGDPHLDDGEDGVSSYQYYTSFRSGIWAKDCHKMAPKDRMTGLSKSLKFTYFTTFCRSA